MHRNNTGSYFPPLDPGSVLIPHSVPTSPLHHPLPSSNVHAPMPQINTNKMRLLMPTVRPTRSNILSPLVSAPKSPRLKPTTSNKSHRTRSGSNSAELSPPANPADLGSIWIGKQCRFEIVKEQLEIHGYQMYAVEKWWVWGVPFMNNSKTHCL